MARNMHRVQLDREFNELAHAQAKAVGLSKTRYLQEMITTLAGEADPIERGLVSTKLVVEDDEWQAVADHARSRGRTVSAIVIDTLQERAPAGSSAASRSRTSHGGATPTSAPTAGTAATATSPSPPAPDCPPTEGAATHELRRSTARVRDRRHPRVGRRGDRLGGPVVRRLDERFRHAAVAAGHRGLRQRRHADRLRRDAAESVTDNVIPRYACVSLPWKSSGSLTSGGEGGSARSAVSARPARRLHRSVHARCRAPPTLARLPLPLPLDPAAARLHAGARVDLTRDTITPTQEEQLNMTRELHEVLSVRVGVVGMTEEGLGTANVTLDLEGSDESVGQALARGFRDAHAAAIRDVGPKLTRVWTEQGRRLIDGDDTPES
ncbi:hypothetical protein Q3G72_016102 [Acer saccharum]|nr:hypothetical protein Q3G72_016102 [Acer saccharum]